VIEWFDDLKVGMKFKSDEITVSKEGILRFASEFDPQPFHLDEEAAKNTVFKGLAASGWHTAAIAMRLATSCRPFGPHPLLGAGVDDLRWPKPVRPGDTLHLEGEVVELVPSTPRVFPVGRLDFDTEGLLLLTNDGELTQLLTHPSFGVVKTYLAEVDGDPSPGTRRRLREGVELDDGLTAPARVKVVQRRGDTAAVEIGIHEGRNRQVRRMCEAVGHPVLRLVRTRIGPLHDGKLKPGDWRPLSAGEVRRLYEAATPSDDNSPEAENPSG